MAGTIEAVERADRASRPHVAPYRCAHSQAATTPPAPIARPGSAEAAPPQQGPENTQNDREPDINCSKSKLSGGKGHADVNMDVTGSATERNATAESEEVSFHRAKVADGLSRGNWDDAEEHLSILLEDLEVGDIPDMQILRAMACNSRARWREAVDILEGFTHQSASEPELSARAYYARAVALYKLRDYEASHTNSRRGLAIAEKLLKGSLQQKYRVEFADLAARTLEDLGNTSQSAKADFYKSLIPDSHTPDPILLVTTISEPAVPITHDELLADMKKHRLSFGHDGKIIVGRQKDIFLALHHALETDNLPLMTLICSNEWCATQSFLDSTIKFDLDDPMPRYPWKATTLLHVVAGSHSKYSAPMAQLLLDKGANPQTTLFEGITPLHICARQTNAEVAAVLIKNGANIEARSITGKPPIHFAAWKASWNADVRILKMLIAAGANINAKNSGGYTALHWCMFDGRSSAPIEVLLQRPEIDKYVRAGTHKTPWDIFWEHEDEFAEKGEERRTQILYTLKRYGISR